MSGLHLKSHYDATICCLLRTPSYTSSIAPSPVPAISCRLAAIMQSLSGRSQSSQPHGPVSTSAKISTWTKHKSFQIVAQDYGEDRGESLASALGAWTNTRVRTCADVPKGSTILCHYKVRSTEHRLQCSLLPASVACGRGFQRAKPSLRVSA